MNSAAALVIKVTSDASKAGAGMDSATGKVSKLGKAGSIAGKALAAGLLLAVGAAIKFTAAAAEDQAAAAKLAQTAQQVAGATSSQTAAMEDWITAQGKALGVTDDELRPALEKLITATGSVEEAQKLAAVAMDVSARSGKSLDSVSQTLAKAQVSGGAALAKYGVQAKDSSGKVKDLASIQDELAAKYKGAAGAAADTAAGKQKRLQVAMGELQEEIGTKLLPVLLKASEYGLKVVDWIDKNQAAAAAILGTLAGLLAIIKAVSLATQAFTAIQTLLNVVMSANPVVLIVLALVALAAAFVIAYKKSETFRNIVDKAFAGIKDVIGSVTKVVGAVIDFIRDHWKLIVGILTGPIGAAVILIISHWDKIKAAAGAVIDWVRSKWPAIKELITTPFTTARDVVDTAIGKITGFFSSAKSTLSTAATSIKNDVGGAFDAVAGAVQAVVDKIQAAIDKVQALIDKGKDLLSVDFNPLNKIAGRGSVTTAGGQLALAHAPAPIQVTINAPGGFIGSEVQLARVVQPMLDQALRRVGIKPR